MRSREEQRGTKLALGKEFIPSWFQIRTLVIWWRQGHIEILSKVEVTVKEPPGLSQMVWLDGK